MNVGEVFADLSGISHEGKAIRGLPVAALGLDEEATLGLVRAGLKSIGAVAARSSAALAARFGIEAVRALEGRGLAVPERLAALAQAWGAPATGRRGRRRRS